MIFELASYRAFDRPVSGIVDAGRHFVGHQVPLIFEKLDSQNASVVELGKNAASDIFRFPLKSRGQQWSWCDRKPQNAAVMAILHQRVKDDVAVARAHTEDGKFTGER